MTRFALSGLLAAAFVGSTASAQVQSINIWGNLLVWGGNTNDAISMTGTNGSMSVIGNSGTTVNGQGSVTYSNIGGVVLVLMNGGNDSVFISDGDFSCSLAVCTGSGDDLVFAARNAIEGHFLVDGGSTGVAGDLIVLSDPDGVGNDVDGSLAVGSAFATIVITGSNIGRDLIVETGGGADLLEIDGCNVGGDMSLDTGSGNDTLLVGSYATAVGNVIHDRVDIRSGSGADVVRFGSSTGAGSVVHGRSDIRTGSGTDLLQVRHSTFDDRVNLRGNEQADTVEVQSPAFMNTFGNGLVLEGFETTL